MTTANDSLRILHLIPTLGGGGAERQLVYLAGALKSLGHDVHVGFLHRGPNLEPLARTGAALHPIRSFGNYDPRLFFGIRRLMSAIRPHLVQTWLTQMDMLGGLAALSRRTPWVLSERAGAAAYDGGPKNRARRFLAARATAIVANSAVGRDYWSAAPSAKYIIGNAVNVKEIEQAEPEALDIGSAKLILFAGRLEAQKNVETLLTALEQVLERRDAFAILFGTGSREHQLRSRIERMAKAERIRLHGYTGRLWNHMKRADVFVSPSWFEGQPNVVLEAAAIGCPLVVSDIPEHRAFLGEASARLVPPSDASALAAAILETLDDPNAARNRAGEARRIVENWSPDAIAAEYVQVYRHALAPF